MMENPQNNADSYTGTEINISENSETEKFIEIVLELNFKAEVNTEIDADNNSSMRNNETKHKYNMQNRNQPLLNSNY